MFYNFAVEGGSFVPYFIFRLKYHFRNNRIPFCVSNWEFFPLSKSYLRLRAMLTIVLESAMVKKFHVN